MARNARDWDESDVRIRPNKKGTRPRTKDRPAYEDARIGRIITVDRGRYRAILDEDTPEERVVVAARARLVRIQERSTLLRRSADDTDPVERVVVANVDQLVIVVAAANPEPRTGFIDRAIVAAFDAGIHPLLCITKADVRDPEPFLENYRHLDIDIVVSRTTDESATGIDARSADGLSARLAG